MCEERGLGSRSLTSFVAATTSGITAVGVLVAILNAGAAAWLTPGEAAFYVGRVAESVGCGIVLGGTMCLTMMCLFERRVDYARRQQITCLVLGFVAAGVIAGVYLLCAAPLAAAPAPWGEQALGVAIVASGLFCLERVVRGR